MQLDLEKIRGEINAIDDEITRLYETRLALCDEVAAYKMSTGKAVLDKSREDMIISRLTAGVKEENRDAVSELYKRIFEISRSRQSEKITGVNDFYKELSEKMKKSIPFPSKTTDAVACQGVDGAYSSIACKTLFDAPATIYFENFESVFKSVSAGLCRYGILPFENSIYGSVSEVYEMLSHFDGHVVGSVKLPIHHALLANNGSSLSDIKEIYSHRQAIGQCSIFLSQNKNVKVIPCENTAVAAKMVAESGRRDIAAICSPVCADKYGLSVLQKDLQNASLNYTMFYCISKELEVFEGVNKAAFMFDLKDEAGSLESVLSRFSMAKINLTKIESRPIPGRDFDFMFYAEADTKGIDDKMLALFTQLEEELDFFKFVGIYKEVCAQ